MEAFQFLDDPKRRAEAARVQSERRAATPLRKKHPAQIRYEFAVNAEARLELRVGSAQFGDATYLALAQALAEQGQFDKAALHLHDGVARLELEAKAKAMLSVGREGCTCPRTIRKPVPYDAKGLEIPTRTKRDEVWIPESDSIVTLYQCDCGAWSAK